MFFSITQQAQDNFQFHYYSGPFVVNTDDGWKNTTIGGSTFIYKGYADEFDLSSNIERVIKQSTPQFTGNFCVFECLGDQIKIYNSRYRSFPIYIAEDTVNNLIPKGETVWADKLVTVNSDMSVIQTPFDVIGEINTLPLTQQQVETAIIDILDKKTRAFLSHNKLPINVFLSGGIDSLLVYSFLKKYTKEYKLIKCSHIDYDYFWLKNSGDITKFGLYNQIHHWTTPCVLTSGTSGDNVTLRAVFTCNMLLMHYGINIFELLNQRDGMQKKHLLKTENIKVFNSMLNEENSSLIKDKKSLYYQICNMIVNDWQHWHIGNTLTWTPLLDLEIVKLMLRLPINDIIDQFLDSKISLNIIKHNSPDLVHSLSKDKDVGNTMENLTNFYFKVDK